MTPLERHTSFGRTTAPDASGLARRIAQGAGAEPADLVLRDVRLLDLVTGELLPCDIAICGEVIVGTLERYEGRAVIEGRGRIAVPGFVDTHLHVESSLLAPGELARCVLARGTTTMICDPHEIANVLGVEGIRWMLDWAAVLPLDLRVQLSSCVPATEFETAGARLEAEDLAPLLARPEALGLAEVMNFPGVLARDPGLLAKLAAFADRPIDGHCPLLAGKGLCGYAAAGIRTEHEATRAEEALEKLRKGFHVLIREGSVSKDLRALAPLISPETSPFLAFCTDDRNPLDIEEEGHVDFLVREAIRTGAPAHHVYRVASWSGARAFGLFDRGLLAPGRRADIVLLDDLASCAVSEVIVGGRPVRELLAEPFPGPAPVGLGSVRMRRLSAADFRIPAPAAATVPVIGVIPGKIITERLEASPPRRAGELLADPAADLAKVAVIERHGKNGNIGRGFVRGFGLARGAIASSVGHDSHNVTVVGVDDAAMALAANRVAELGGGFVVAHEGRVLAELALPIAGLMSDRPFADVTSALRRLRAPARGLGCRLPEPFLQVSFLPLPVIPHLKITDRGLFDVDRFALVELV
ncbi:MAG: adenine deaminase [Geminicoccaceae bacterium]|nr:adenine deaminase [Geminicoccaceae bacterium]